MGQAEPVYGHTKDDYLRIDAESETKLDFYKGRIYSMAGASPDHNLIVANTIRHVGNGLEGKGCRTFASDQRVANGTSEFYTYPDITVACPPLDFDHTENPATLRNPKVIFEVLSPSTAAYDQSKKFEQFRAIPSLQQVVFLASTEVRVTAYTRANDFWIFREYVSLEEVLELGAIGVSIPVGKLYEHVAFSDTPVLEEATVYYNPKTAAQTPA